MGQTAKWVAKLGATVLVAGGLVVVNAGVASADLTPDNTCAELFDNSNGGGANQSPGPYDNTCEPEHEPGNGSENGNAFGQPCAGCVGNADDMNPPGQFPDGSDNNNGYECDGNEGIGQENPAHTSCQESPPPPS